MLVVVNALGADVPAAFATAALSEAEFDVVHDWVMGRGCLLLIADHAPVDVAPSGLARRFGGEMVGGSDTPTTADRGGA